MTASVMLAGCASIPDGHRFPIPEPRGEGLLLLAHGHDSNPGYWPAGLIRAVDASEFSATGWDSYAHDWEEQTHRVLTAARTGYALGEEIARRVMDAGNEYLVIHLVGHSLGAFLIQGFADEYRRLGGRSRIVMSFLDPFLIRGVFGWGYGVRHFGRGADFAENFIVRKEPLIGTNRFLRHAHNTDVTELVDELMPEGARNPHAWVVRYYVSTVSNCWPGFDRSPLAAGLPLQLTSGDGGEGANVQERLQALDTYLARRREAFPPGERVFPHSE